MSQYARCKENHISLKESNNSNNNSNINEEKTSISTNSNINKSKNSYNNFISKIKLNYNLLHPQKRKQTIIIHSNLDKSISINDSLLYDNSVDLVGNSNKRRSMNHINSEFEEEEKNNQYDEPSKNEQINLSELFKGINSSKKLQNKDKVYISQNGFIDNIDYFHNQQNINNKKIEDNGQNNNISSFNDFYNNNIQDLNPGIKDKDVKKYTNPNKNHLDKNINNLGTYANIHNKNLNENKHISSFAPDINNSQNNLFLQNIRKSKSFFDNNFKERNEKNSQDIIELNKNNYKNNAFDDITSNIFHKNSFPQKYSQNNKSNVQNNELMNNNGIIYNKNERTRKINLFRKEKEDKIKDKQNNNDIYYNHYNNEDENEDDNSQNKKYNDYYNQNNDNSISESNIKEKKQDNEDISLTIKNLKEGLGIIPPNKKEKNILKSFFYGLLFGSTASGIFWLKNAETRKYFWEKIKNINFNSIISFLKSIFAHPIEFFNKLLRDEKMKDYIKIFGLTLGKFIDIFENYNDLFRLVGIALSIYLIWFLIKSLIKAFFMIWKYYN